MNARAKRSRHQMNPQNVCDLSRTGSMDWQGKTQLAVGGFLCAHLYSENGRSGGWIPPAHSGIGTRASDQARALVRYGTAGLGLERVVGLAHPENNASKRVLVKAGLVSCGVGHYAGKALSYFVTACAVSAGERWLDRLRKTKTRRR